MKFQGLKKVSVKVHLLLLGEDDLVASVETPGDGVELEVGRGDLLLFVELKVVEALDRVLRAADLGEVPVPDDLVGAGHEDRVGLSAKHRRSTENTSDVALLAVKCDLTELHKIDQFLLLTPNSPR